ncbi:hypothetical protein HanXRQr2_Chr02g0047141 [Helianthus annuus]|uniref:Uncharacterized protein n=1 Tax=Helianthus annuus TaxID=4232 RepID=A0A9K3JKF3_HELAN|nr:hypothetical protein HanXRQr2_Chr02g0047141 [Helianthus annuus]
MAFYVCISVDHADFWGSAVWLFFERDFIKKPLLRVFHSQIWIILFKTLQNTYFFQTSKP